MARHGFGSGEYRYFAYPLPDAVARLRTAVYPHLAEVANRWNERMALETRYPERHGQFLDRCQAAGQTRPTPLLLRYGEDRKSTRLISIHQWETRMPSHA